MNMNLPNKLTVMRIIMIPFFMVFILLPDAGASKVWCDFIAALIFGAASLTDMYDGKIARERGLVTDFGKFLDPIADKFLVLGAFFCFIVSEEFAAYRYVFSMIVFIVIFRELAVTSLRMIAQSAEGVVIAANWLGKVKTVSQIIFILVALLEEHIFFFSSFMVNFRPLTVASCLVMLIFTVISGINYIKGYWKFLDPTK